MKSFKFQLKAVLTIVSGTVAISAFANILPADKRVTNQRTETNLTQIIVKYRSEPAMYVQSASTAQNKAATTQLQAQRMANLQTVAQSFGTNFSLKRQMATGGWVYHSNVPLSPVKMRALAAKLASHDSSIEYAEPDYIRHAMYVPTAKFYAKYQWDMQTSATQMGSLNVPAAWDATLGKNVIVAVLDTGYRPHPDLLPNLVPSPGTTTGKYGYNFITDPTTARITVASGITSARGNDALDQGDWVPDGDTDCPSQAGKSSSWHGTHVAGTIAASGIGVIGVASQAKVLPLRVLGKCGGFDSDIADAVAWAAGLPVSNAPINPTKANVINLSLGGSGVCSKTYATVFQQAIAQGTTVVVAAGNENIDAKISAPANCPGVITVASSNILGGRSFYSNYGGTVTVAAPGGGYSDYVQGATSIKDIILSTLPTGDTTSTDDTTYGFMAGTSQATPHVSGVIALMLAVNPSLTPAKIKNILISTARSAPASCPGCGAGIVDAAAAVNAAASGK